MEDMVVMVVMVGTLVVVETMEVTPEEEMVGTQVGGMVDTAEEEEEDTLAVAMEDTEAVVDMEEEDVEEEEDIAATVAAADHHMEGADAAHMLVRLWMHSHETTKSALIRF